jgi:hypothetical protein
MAQGGTSVMIVMIVRYFIKDQIIRLECQLFTFQGILQKQWFGKLGYD